MPLRTSRARSPPPIATLWFPDANAFAPAANAKRADAHTDASAEAGPEAEGGEEVGNALPEPAAAPAGKAADAAGSRLRAPLVSLSRENSAGVP